MTYEQSAAQVGAAADHELIGVRAELVAAHSAVADVTSQLTSALDAATQCEAELSAERLRTQALEAENAELDLKVKRLRKQLAALQPKSPTLFAAKPEPSTEAEYAAASARAGAPYRLHNHYAMSWAQAVTLVNACTAPFCRVTVASLAVDAQAIGSFRKDKTVILGTLHEPEDNVESGQITLAAWKGAQTKTRQGVDAANLSRPVEYPIIFGLCLQGPWTWDARSGRNPDDYFMPGVHEYIGSDPYTEFMNKSNELAVTAEQMLGPVANYAKAKGVFPAIMEWGIHANDPANDPGARARLIRSVNAYAREHGFLCVLYWDHGTCYCRNDDEFAAAGGA